MFENIGRDADSDQHRQHSSPRNGKRILVERDFGSYRYYEAQNCLLYETRREPSTRR